MSLEGIWVNNMVGIEYFKKCNIRRKILLPFILIVSVMTISAAIITSYVVIKSSETRLYSQLHFEMFKISNDLHSELQFKKTKSGIVLATDKTKLFSKNKFEGESVYLFIDEKPKPLRILAYEGPDALIDPILQAIPAQLKKNDMRVLKFKIKSNNQSFQAVAENFSQTPKLFIVTLRSSKSVNSTTLKIIIASIALLLLVNSAVFLIYSMIVRNITKTLEILTTAASKAATGEWTPEVVVNSQDEVGKLSQVLNQMVLAINESSNRILIEKNQSEAILSCIPEGIVVTDMENHLLMANSMAESLFQFSSEKAHGKFLLEYISNEDIIHHFKEDVQTQKKQIQREVLISDAEGKDRVFSLNSSLVVHSKTKENIGVITIVRDVTHEKELGELREGFLRTVTHELRTPLTSIMGFIELVKNSDNAKTETRKDWLSIALEEASNLKDLIDDLLDLSQISAGRVSISVETIKVSDLLNHLIQTFSPLARGKQLDLLLGAVDPNLEIRADMSKLRRILVNLISNALKFTTAGYIRLDCIDEGPDVVFSVADTGIGLKNDETEVIFEKFRQIDYSSTRKYEGIGLGLSIVKQLVEMHGGRVWVSSVYGRGTSFYFSLPKNTKTVNPTIIG